MSEELILPTMADWWLVPRIAAATAMKAQESGLARVTRSRDEYIETAMRRIQDAQQTLQVLTREGLIAPMPADCEEHDAGSDRDINTTVFMR